MNIITRGRWDPRRELAILNTRFGRVLGDLAGSGNGSAEEGVTSSWMPALDVFENDGEINLRAELPGLVEDDVEITVENHQLTLRGEKKFDHAEEDGLYRRLESNYGSFYRCFSLPTTVDRENIEAVFTNGVLLITLPKVEEAKPKRIEVRAQ